MNSKMANKWTAERLVLLKGKIAMLLAQANYEYNQLAEIVLRILISLLTVIFRFRYDSVVDAWALESSRGDKWLYVSTMKEVSPGKLWIVGGVCNGGAYDNTYVYRYSWDANGWPKGCSLLEGSFYLIGILVELEK